MGTSDTVRGTYKLKWKSLIDGWVLGVMGEMGTSDTVRGHCVVSVYEKYKLKLKPLFDGLGIGVLNI